MKSLNIPKESQDALLNGASMFIIPLSSGQQNFEEYLIDPIDIISKYKIGDEVYFETAKEFICDYCKGKNSNCTDCYGTGKVLDVDKQFKATIKDVKVVRLHDLFSIGASALLGAWSKTEEDLKDWYNKQYGNYEENPYVFLYEVKETK